MYKYKLVILISFKNQSDTMFCTKEFASDSDGEALSIAEKMLQEYNPELKDFILLASEEERRGKLELVIVRASLSREDPMKVIKVYSRERIEQIKQEKESDSAGS